MVKFEPNLRWAPGELSKSWTISHGMTLREFSRSSTETFLTFPRFLYQNFLSLLLQPFLLSMFSACTLMENEKVPFRLKQWFLIWVRSNPKASVSQFQGFSGLFHPTCVIRDITLCLASLCANTVYICFELEEKITFYFSNYEGFDECMYGICGIQYLQKG